MPSFTIKSGLSSAFIILIGAMGLICFVAFNKLSAVNGSAEQLGRNYLPSVDVAHRINADVGDLRIAEAAHIMSTDEAAMRAIETSADGSIARLKADMDAYEKLISSDEERKNYSDFSGAIKAYLSLHDRLLSLSRSNKNEEAAALFKGDMVEPFEKLNSGADSAIKLNTSGANSEYLAAQEDYHSAIVQMQILCVIGALIALAALAYTRISVVRSILGMSEAMTELAKGDTSVTIPSVGKADEIGAMAAAVDIFKTSMIETERLRAEQADAERRAAEQRKTDMNRLADQFQRAVGGIVEKVSKSSVQLEGAANILTATATRTQEKSTVVASASEQTSANVQGVAAASEELASTVTEISRQVQESSNIANEAVKQAAKTNGQVSELSQTAERIGDVVGLINSIAGQTNLLALNATIEAARAGDAGKGFAVVAQEVKALAAQTGKATNEIETQIASMQTATREAVSAIGEISETIRKMSEIATAIAAAVEEQGATTQEISRNVSEAAKGTGEVANSITEVSKGAEETGSASSQVFASAKELSAESERLNREVASFVATVRAA